MRKTIINKAKNRVDQLLKADLENKVIRGATAFAAVPITYGLLNGHMISDPVTGLEIAGVAAGEGALIGTLAHHVLKNNKTYINNLKQSPPPSSPLKSAAIGALSGATIGGLLYGFEEYSKHQRHLQDET